MKYPWDNLDALFESSTTPRVLWDLTQKMAKALRPQLVAEWQKVIQGWIDVYLKARTPEKSTPWKLYWKSSPDFIAKLRPFVDEATGDLKPAVDSLVKAAAESHTTRVLLDFNTKLDKKLAFIFDKKGTPSSYEVDVRGSSIIVGSLTVDFDDMTGFTVTLNTKVNYTKYGDPYLQWPLVFSKIKTPDGKVLAKKPEDWMKTGFLGLEAAEVPVDKRAALSPKRASELRQAVINLMRPMGFSFQWVGSGSNPGAMVSRDGLNYGLFKISLKTGELTIGPVKAMTPDDFVKQVLAKSRAPKTEAKKKKKCKLGILGDAACFEEPWWAFAPLYGAGGGDGKVTTTPGGSPSPQSPALPGPGGINAPGVPAGPNSGMGPVTASASDGGQSPEEEPVDSLKALGESLDAVTTAMGFDLPEAPPPAPMPTLVPASESTFADVATAILSGTFGRLADLCLATGTCGHDQRVLLGRCFDAGMQAMRDEMMGRCPWTHDGLPAEAAAELQARARSTIG